MLAGALTPHTGHIHIEQVPRAGLCRRLLLGSQLLPVREVHPIVQVLRHGLMLERDLHGAELRAIVHDNNDEDGQEDKDDNNG